MDLNKSWVVRRGEGTIIRNTEVRLGHGHRKKNFYSASRPVSEGKTIDLRRSEVKDKENRSNERLGGLSASRARLRHTIRK